VEGTTFTTAFIGAPRTDFTKFFNSSSNPDSNQFQPLHTEPVHRQNKGLSWEIQDSLLQKQEFGTDLAYSHHLHNHPLPPLPIKLRIEDTLPCAQVEASGCDWERCFVVKQERLQMRVAVVLAGLMVFVVGPLGRQLLEPFADVFDEPALMVVHVDCGGDVHGRYETQSIFDPATPHDLFDLFGNVDHLLPPARFEDQVLGVALHFCSQHGRSPQQSFRSAYILKNVVTEMKRTRAEELLERALNQLVEDDAQGAIENFRAAISEDPDYFEAHHGLIRALRDAGRLEQSIGAALALTAITPDDPLAHTALSISLQQAGHIPEAETAAARARVLEWKAQLKVSIPDKKP
jgi:hypothetical protein